MRDDIDSTPPSYHSFSALLPPTPPPVPPSLPPSTQVLMTNMLNLDALENETVLTALSSTLGIGLRIEKEGQMLLQNGELVALLNEYAPTEGTASSRPKLQHDHDPHYAVAVVNGLRDQLLLQRQQQEDEHEHEHEHADSAEHQHKHKQQQQQRPPRQQQSMGGVGVSTGHGAQSGIAATGGGGGGGGGGSSGGGGDDGPTPGPVERSFVHPLNTSKYLRVIATIAQYKPFVVLYIAREATVDRTHDMRDAHAHSAEDANEVAIADAGAAPNATPSGKGASKGASKGANKGASKGDADKRERS